MLLQKAELRRRVLAKSMSLEREIDRLRAEAAGKTTEHIEKIERNLERLRHTLRAGWDRISAEVARNLGFWLEDHDV